MKVSLELETICCCKTLTKIDKNAMQSILRKKKINDIYKHQIKQQVSIHNNQSSQQQKLCEKFQSRQTQQIFDYDNKNQYKQPANLTKTEPHEFYQKDYTLEETNPISFSQHQQNQQVLKNRNIFTNHHLNYLQNNSNLSRQNNFVYKNPIKIQEQYNKENNFIDSKLKDITIMQQLYKEKPNQFRKILTDPYGKTKQLEEIEENVSHYTNKIEFRKDDELQQIFKNQLDRLKGQFGYVHKKIYGNEEQAIKNLLVLFREQLNNYEYADKTKYNIPTHLQLIELSLKKYIDSLQIPKNYNKQLQQLRLSRKTSESRIFQTERRNSQLWEKLNNQQSRLIQRLQKHYSQDRLNYYDSCFY